jgi:tRNA(His) 5'-end guanylyltransferase
MNTTLLDRLRSFQIPPATPIVTGHHIVARLMGVDFDGIFNSPEFGFARPFDPRFGKMMLRTASHLLGGDACGRFAFTELSEMSVLLDHRSVSSHWSDATDLQSYLVAIAASKMSLEVEEEVVFTCKLYSFSKSDLAVAYFLWRRQEAAVAALDRYCEYVLGKDSSNPEGVAKLIDGLGLHEKEEILRQNNIEYKDLPAWQRQGAAVHLADEDNRVAVETNLPHESAYGPYLQQYID